MALITWSDELSVHISEIDAQHKELIKYINNLNDAMLLKQGHEVLGSILERLIRYTVMHFGKEEQYFNKFAYVETMMHRREHYEFINKLLDLKKEFESGNKSAPTNVLSFLYDWLLKHIKCSDKRYIACFIHNGLR